MASKIVALAGTLLCLSSCSSEPTDRTGRPTTAAESPAATELESASLGPAPTGTGSISGQVWLDGKTPKLRPIKMGADPTCHSQHPTGAANPSVIVTDDGLVKDVLVMVKSGLSPGTYATSGRTPLLDQKGCIYQPRVVVVRTGQELKVRNSDATLHNVHAMAKENQGFNRSMVTKGQEFTTIFDKAERIAVKCDVHPWMKAYVIVSDHPYATVTDAKGRFTLQGLAAGEYVVEAWHSSLGTTEQTVTVADGEATTLDLTLAHR